MSFSRKGISGLRFEIFTVRDASFRGSGNCRVGGLVLTRHDVDLSVCRFVGLPISGVGMLMSGG